MNDILIYSIFIYVLLTTIIFITKPSFIYSKKNKKFKDFGFDRVSVFAYSKEEDTAAFDMEQVPFKVINKRLKIIEKIVDEVIEKSFEKEVGQKRLVVCTGESSEGEFFIAAKDLRWDREIDGEILINESECGNLKMGQIYECEILQNLDKKLLAKALRKVDAN